MEEEKPAKSQVYSREQYATKQFWENRYKQNQGYFDWYAEFPELKETFQKFYNLQFSHKILMLGCGNSKLSEQMYEAGYHNIVNIDISPTVIEQMQHISNQKGHDKMKWLVMDATDMQQFTNQEFDVVIDKGTLDALIAGKNLSICQKMTQQSLRVLKKDGQFILITHGSPEGRKKLFENALNFENYDYYVTRVDLSTMGTLINLMRSNLGNKPLNAIMKDQEAMQKSMLEFNLIQMLRKKRKAEKKYIVWSDYQKKNVVFNENQQQQPTQKQPQQAPKKTIYNPKKQCFCYVYSIQHKFASDINQTVTLQPNNYNINQLLQKYQLSQKLTGNLIKFSGNQSLTDFGLMALGNEAQRINFEIIRSLIFLQKSQIANNPVNLYLNQQQYAQGKNKVKFRLKVGANNYMPLYAKSVINFKINMAKFNGKLSNIEKKLNQLSQQLTQQGNLHPSSFQYSFLGILLQKISPNTYYHKLLKKFWYPTWRIVAIDNLNQASCQISLPPSANLESSIDIITKLLKNYLKAEPQIARKGYLAYIEPKIFDILTLCSSLYCQEDRIQFVVEQFIELDQVIDNGNNAMLVVSDVQIIGKMLARIFSAY